jgi:hypothetical protein
MLPGWLDAAGALFQAGDIRHARQILDRLARFGAPSADVWYWLSQCDLAPEDSRVCLENALRLAPDHAGARTALANMVVPVATRVEAVPTVVVQPHEVWAALA